MEVADRWGVPARDSAGSQRHRQPAAPQRHPQQGRACHADGGVAEDEIAESLEKNSIASHENQGQQTEPDRENHASGLVHDPGRPVAAPQEGCFPRDWYHRLEDWARLQTSGPKERARTSWGNAKAMGKEAKEIAEPHSEAGGSATSSSAGEMVDR